MQIDMRNLLTMICVFCSVKVVLLWLVMFDVLSSASCNQLVMICLTRVLHLNLPRYSLSWLACICQFIFIGFEIISGLQSIILCFL